MSRHKRKEGEAVKPLPPRLSLEQVREIGTMYHNGISARQVSTDMGIDLARVRNVLHTLKKHGAVFPKVSRAGSSQYDEIAKLFN